MLQVVPTGKPCSTCGYETSYTMLRQYEDEETIGWLCDCCDIEWCKETMTGNLLATKESYKALAREFVKKRFEWTAEDREEPHHVRMNRVLKAHFGVGT